MTGPRSATTDRLIETPWHGLFLKEGFTPREQFSASQDSTVEGCLYSWGLRYLLGLRQQEKIWFGDGTGLTKREKSLAFGKELHSRLEAHFRGLPVDWTDDVGQRALAGLYLLPEAPPVYVEQEIAFDSGRFLAGIEPISVVGFKDLSAPGRLYDYKTTGDFRWVKKGAELQEDLAACLYADDDIRRYDLTARDCRWVYFARTGRPEARAVDFMITKDQAMLVIRSALIRMSRLRQEVRDYREASDQLIGDQNSPTVRLPLIEHLTKNTRNCQAYGGCPYHFAAGGPCTAEASPGAELLIDYSRVTEPKQPTEKADPNMVTLAERLAAGKAAPPNAAQPQHTAPHGPAPGANPFPAMGGQPPVFNPAQGACPAPGANPFPAMGGQPPVFNPAQGAYPAPGAAPAFPGAIPPTAPAAAAPPPVPPAAPVAPFPGFPPVVAPAQTQPAPATPAQPQAGYGAPPQWAGVNPPEQHQQPAQAPVPPLAGVVAPDVPSAPPTRRTRAQIEADNAALTVPAVAVVGASTFPPATPGLPSYLPFSDGLLTVTIRVSDGRSAIELEAPAEIAEAVAAHCEPIFAQLAIG